MNGIDIQGTPVIFDSLGEAGKRVTKINLGQILFYHPNLIPLSASTATTGYRINVRILQSSRYSILWEDGTHRNDVDFFPNGIRNVFLPMTIIADETVSFPKHITLIFRITGTGLVTITKQFTYAIK